MQTIQTLQTEIKGRVIEPSDPEYDEARKVFLGGIDRRPAHIVRVADAADVARTVDLARESGLELAVRSGGHGALGYGVVDGGIVIDVRDMRSLSIDPDERTAWAETGLTAGEYSEAAQAYGLATSFGDTGSVGIGGLTLGGGVGYLSRKYGLTIDHLLGAEVVTADGKVLRTDAETHPDLFWAIRGGGGNFGVATRFNFRLHEVGTVLGGILILPATAQSITSFVAAADAAPEELTTIANVMPAPPLPFIPAEHHGKIVIMAPMVHAGPIEAGERAVAPFRSLAQPIVDGVRPMPYPQIYPPEDPTYHPLSASRTLFLDTVDEEDAQTIIKYLNKSTAQLRAAQLRVLGGAMARVPADATAYAHRARRIMVNLAALHDGGMDAAQHEAWVDGFWRALRHGQPGAYVNFLVNDGPSRMHEAYPNGTWDRLRAIKARYDPTNLFRLNQNIAP